MKNAITVRAVMAFSLLTDEMQWIRVLQKGEKHTLKVTQPSTREHRLGTGASSAFEVSMGRPPGYHHYDVQVSPDYREQRLNE
jgi:hypothetical protein